MDKSSDKYKIIQKTIDGEVYRADTSILLAYDEVKHLYLFRSLNSNYFLQDDHAEEIILLPADEAEQMWHRLPDKNVNNVVAAFPMSHGGIGMDTYTNLYDD